MPKITSSQGPSIAFPQEFDQGQFFNNGEKGGEDLSAGNNSSESETSNEKTPDKPEKTNEHPKPAPTTESPSSAGRTGGSSVRRTAGGPGKPGRR